MTRYQRMTTTTTGECIENKALLSFYIPFSKISTFILFLDDEGYKEMEKAKENMLKVIKHVNDVMHQIAITGYKGDISLLGNLLMQVMPKHHRPILFLLFYARTDLL